MAAIDKLSVSYYGDYYNLRLWCLNNKPSLLKYFYDAFLSSKEFNNLQKEHSKNQKESPFKLVIANFKFRQDLYLYWHCPFDFVREYLETQCGYKKANWFVKLFWKY